MPLDLHKHIWSTTKTSYYDRYNWITIERCRKCPALEQVVWNIRMVEGKLQSKCERSKVLVIDKDKQSSVEKFSDVPVDNSPSV